MGEPQVAKKACNCLIANAEADLSRYSAVAALLGVDLRAVEDMLKRFRARYGGLWVGGSAELTTATLTFRPNTANRKVHKDDYSFSVPLSDMIGITCRRGFVTNVIVITTSHGEFKLRCFGARRFADLIARTRRPNEPLQPTSGANPAC